MIIRRPLATRVGCKVCSPTFPHRCGHAPRISGRWGPMVLSYSGSAGRLPRPDRLGEWHVRCAGATARVLNEWPPTRPFGAAMGPLRCFRRLKMGERRGGSVRPLAHIGYLTRSQNKIQIANLTRKAWRSRDTGNAGDQPAFDDVMLTQAHHRPEAQFPRPLRSVERRPRNPEENGQALRLTFSERMRGGN